MITNLLFDFSRVILFPKDESYNGLLNDLYRKVRGENGLFLDYFKFNTELLNYLGQFKDKYTLSIFTTDIVQNDSEAQKIIKPIFRNVFSAKNLGISKKDSKGYLVIAEKLKVDPSEILFVDDGAANIAAAKTAGLRAIRYLSNEQLFNDLKSILADFNRQNEQSSKS
ncbi:HAD-IA family hydrolase [Candidatus Daviesbacteria bacterium]|nr:HAD-IA family hydrolase [Candidatus Daviesbacteria bacterium]